MTNTLPELQSDIPTIRHLTQRVEAEYAEMPGLSVTMPQAQRLLGIDRHTCVAVLRTLTDQGFLKRTSQGRYVRM